MFGSGAVILAAALAGPHQRRRSWRTPFFGAGRAYAVETRAHRLFADAGESGPTFDVAAMISVLVTRDGPRSPTSALRCR
jgi:hypothetical protein